VAASEEQEKTNFIARLAADRATPMEAESSIEGRPPGEERQPRGQRARPKRARTSGRPETG